jgi:hypothetical protein
VDEGGVLRLPTDGLPPDPARARRAHRQAAVLRVVAAVSLLTVIPLPGVVEDGPPLVLGPYVPRAWHLAVLAVLLGTGAALVAWAREIRAQDLGRPPGDPRWFVRWPINLAKGVLLVLAWPAAAYAYWLGASTTTVVLDPASAAGCRGVVQEHRFFSTSGDVWLLAAGERRPRHVGTYRADVTPELVTAGRYTLRWEDETAVLDVLGDEYPAFSQSGTRFTCAG